MKLHAYWVSAGRDGTSDPKRSAIVIAYNMLESINVAWGHLKMATAIDVQTRRIHDSDSYLVTRKYSAPAIVTDHADLRALGGGE